jgi:DNA-binding MarR family transcriptional regulator
MASVKQRIINELSKRGTCSFLDLKSALRLSRGDIEANTERLAARGLVRIKKDLSGDHTFYTWIGAKEEARRPDSTRPEKARKKRIIPTKKKPNLFSPGRAGIKKEWDEVSAEVLRRIDAVPYLDIYRKHADGFLKDPRMEEVYRSICKAAKDGKEAIPVFAEALQYGLMFNPARETGFPALADTKKVRALRNNAEELIQFVQEIPPCQYRSNSFLWFRASTEWAFRSGKEHKEYPVEGISDGHVTDALQVVRDFLSAYIPRPRGAGRPFGTDQNDLMLRLESLFKKQFGRPHHAVTALFIETVCGGGVTGTEVKTRLWEIRKRDRA